MKSVDKNISILVAEDDTAVADLINQILLQLGYSNILRASTGVEALKKTSEERPDIVLMDIQMPEMDGLEAIRNIQEKCPTPVVILTSHEETEVLEEASQAGAAAYLVKPPFADQIERAIVIALARHSDLLQLRKLNYRLKKALAEIKTLQGILPICAHCKKIRNEQGNWQQIEIYVENHSRAEFSHGICPECIREHFPEYEDELDDEE